MFHKCPKLFLRHACLERRPSEDLRSSLPLSALPVLARKVFLAVFFCSRAVLGRSWGALGFLGRSWGGLGSLLDRSWAVLGRSWASLGPLFAALGPSAGGLGASWGDLGASWGGFGAAGGAKNVDFPLVFQ